MKHLQNLRLSRPQAGRTPDQSLLASEPFNSGTSITATLGGGGNNDMVYSAGGKSFAGDGLPNKLQCKGVVWPIELDG
jgi:hypothetical protein